MRKRSFKYKKQVHIAACILFILYIAALIYVLFFLETRSETYHNVNLVPFKTLRMLFKYYFTYHHFTPWYWFSNLFGNILLLAILFSIVIEAAQYLTGVGEADIDDVILNTLGALLGYGIYRFLGALYQ